MKLQTTMKTKKGNRKESNLSFKVSHYETVFTWVLNSFQKQSHKITTSSHGDEPVFMSTRDSQGLGANLGKHIMEPYITIAQSSTMETRNQHCSLSFSLLKTKK